MDDNFLEFIINSSKNEAEQNEEIELTPIEKNDLFKLSYHKNKKFPIIDIPNISERLNEMFILLKLETEIKEVNIDNVHEIYSSKNNSYYESSIYNIRYPKVLSKFFSKEEIAEILIFNPYSLAYKMEEYFKYNKAHDFLKSIKLSIHHNGICNNWNEIVDFNNKSISFNPFKDNEDITLTFDTTSWIPSSHGKTKYSKHPETGEFNYIDGEIAFILNYKNKPSFIISLDILNNKEIRIKQIQSLIKKRNKLRFLLGNDFFELIITEFVKHFSDYKVNLITGESLIKQIHKSGKDLKEHDINAFNRVISTYNKDFNKLKRINKDESTKCEISSFKMEYVALSI